MSRKRQLLRILVRFAKPGKGCEWVPCVVWMDLKQPPCGFCATHVVYLLKIGQWLHSWSPEPAQLPARFCPLLSLTALPSWPRAASCSGLIAHKTWHCTGMHLRSIHGNLLLSTFTNNCHQQNTLFISRLGWVELNQLQKSKENNHFLSSSLTFTWNLNLLLYEPRK